MKIGFFGTPEIAADCLRVLCKEFEIVFVVTNPDKPLKRSCNPCAPAVKVCAENECVEILQPLNLKDDVFIEKLKSYNADLFVVFAYGRIIPEAVFSMPRFGSINLHPSLLPKYRGAAPVQWVLINGETSTGVTIQKIAMQLDSGDVLLQKTIIIDPDIDAAGLYDILVPMGIEMMITVIRLLESGGISTVSQNHTEATHCGKIDRDLAKINWSKTNQEIHNLIRGLNPKPYAWTTFRGKELKIIQTKIPEDSISADLKNGEIIQYQKKHLLVGCSTGILEILRLQPETKKPMDSLTFLNGARLTQGESFK